jgi:hypothetical protein
MKKSVDAIWYEPLFTSVGDSQSGVMSPPLDINLAEKTFDSTGKFPSDKHAMEVHHYAENMGAATPGPSVGFSLGQPIMHATTSITHAEATSIIRLGVMLLIV